MSAGFDQSGVQDLTANVPYPLDAFEFVREGLGFTVSRVHGVREAQARARSRDDDPESSESDLHVSGQQLCRGLREFAIERWGLMAPVVLQSWRIQRTDDFGRIVYRLIDVGVLSRTQEDSIDDFRGVYDFSEAFSRRAILSELGQRRAGPVRRS